MAGKLCFFTSFIFVVLLGTAATAQTAGQPRAATGTAAQGLKPGGATTGKVQGLSKAAYDYQKCMKDCDKKGTTTKADAPKPDTSQSTSQGGWGSAGKKIVDTANSAQKAAQSMQVQACHLQCKATYDKEKNAGQ